MAKLSEEEIREALAEHLPGWRLGDGEILKNFKFGSFMEAIRFIDRLAEKAEAADHHPDLENHYNRVAVSLTSHDAGGVTRADLELARAIEAVAEPPEPVGD